MVRWTPCAKAARSPTPGSLPRQRFTKRSPIVCAISTLICGAKLFASWPSRCPLWLSGTKRCDRFGVGIGWISRYARPRKTVCRSVCSAQLHPRMGLTNAASPTSHDACMTTAGHIRGDTDAADRRRALLRYEPRDRTRAVFRHCIRVPPPGWRWVRGIGGGTFSLT